MTVQAKHFVEPRDIVAMRLDCSRCGSTLSIPLAGNINIDKLASCPNCNEPWLKLPTGASVENEVLECIASLDRVAKKLGSKHYPGFSLYLEISMAAVPPLRSGEGT